MRLGRALALAVVGLLVSSAPVWAQGRSQIGTSSGVGRAQHQGSMSHSGGRHDGQHDGHNGGHHGNGNHGFHHRFPGSTLFFPFGFFGYPDTFYSPPAPALAYAPPPPEPPLVRMVAYSTGSYVLYGDGMTTAYQWVWIPNAPPPPPPPPGMPPPPPSGPPSATPEPQSAPSTPSELWTWTDDQGTAHWTDRRDKIPERYRGVAQRRG